MAPFFIWWMTTSYELLSWRITFLMVANAKNKDERQQLLDQAAGLFINKCQKYLWIFVAFKSLHFFNILIHVLCFLSLFYAYDEDLLLLGYQAMAGIVDYESLFPVQSLCEYPLLAQLMKPSDNSYLCTIPLSHKLTSMMPGLWVVQVAMFGWTLALFVYSLLITSTNFEKERHLN